MGVEGTGVAVGTKVGVKAGATVVGGIERGLGVLARVGSDVLVETGLKAEEGETDPMGVPVGVPESGDVALRVGVAPATVVPRPVESMGVGVDRGDTTVGPESLGVRVAEGDAIVGIVASEAGVAGRAVL